MVVLSTVGVNRTTFSHDDTQAENSNRTENIRDKTLTIRHTNQPSNDLYGDSRYSFYSCQSGLSTWGQITVNQLCLDVSVQMKQRQNSFLSIQSHRRYGATHIHLMTQQHQQHWSGFVC